MKMRLPKIFVIVLLTGCTACNPFRNSIHDTLYGSDTDSSYKTKANPAEGNSTSTHVTISSRSTTTTTTERSTSTVISSEGSLLGDENRLEAAERGLRQLPALSGKEIRLYGFIHFYDDGRIMLNIQDPGTPEYIDAYVFNDGSWEGPKPVQLSVHDNIKTALVKLTDLPFKHVAAVYRNYRMKSDGITGAEPPTHIYARLYDNTVGWYPRSISGSRERYFISFHEDGSLDQYYRE